MNTVNKTKIIYGLTYSLGILALLAFGVITMPLVANADTAGVITPYGSTNFNNNVPSNNQYNTYQGQYNTYQGTVNTIPIVYSVPTAPATPIVYSNSSNPNPTSSTTKTTTAKKTSASASKTTSDASNLTANALFGSDGFMPSGLIQWILLAILLLLIVILVRRVYGGKEKYNATPMKFE